MQVVISTGGQEKVVTIEGIAPHLKARIAIASCLWCGEEFLPASAHQVFCSDGCRKTSFRKRDVREAAISTQS